MNTHEEIIENHNSVALSWHISPTHRALNTINRIRTITEGLFTRTNLELEPISLTIGDPTVYGNISPHEEVTKAVLKSTQSGKYNGYGLSVGTKEARSAVAEFFSSDIRPVSSDDVFITIGCSHALEMAINALVEPGQTILIPKPCFPLYCTLAEAVGINVKFYNLLPEKGWAVDLVHLESQIDSTTAALLVNQPSNPCGSVFTAAHVDEILDVAKKHHLPIISDDVYDGFAFSGAKYTRFSDASKDVPILSCCALSKLFIVPGWRLGWIIVFDRHEIFGKKIRDGLKNLSQLILSSCSLIQGALPDILMNTPVSHIQGIIKHCEQNADVSYNILCKVPGLKPIMPSGAMYMMVGLSEESFPDFGTAMDFSRELLAEQSVFTLPGDSFFCPWFLRIVLTPPENKIREACERIAEFCANHYVSRND